VIASTEGVEKLVDRAREAGCVAVDTELVWERTFYPRLGIVQLAFSQTETALIDAPAADDLGTLGEIIADPGIIKILHDAPQDLSILRLATGASPRAIFDTRIASGFAGLASTISLRDLLLEVLGVELHKTETRTDWLQRPLTPTQVEYAEDDVRYLPELRLRLLERARQQGVEAWLREELSLLNNPELYEERDPREQFRRVKGAGRLKRRGLAVLRELAAWREGQAREQDRPRGHIASDRLLLHLAERQPGTREEVAAVRSFRRRDVERYGPGILQAVAAGLAVPDEEWPEGPPRSRFDLTFEKRVRQAVAFIEEKSASRGIDPALVATRADVKALARNGEAGAEGNRLLQGWRAELVGRELVEVAAP